MYRQTSEKRKHEPNDAGLGREEDAIREGRRAVELLPLRKDSLNGANLIKYLGVMYAWTGEKELAATAQSVVIGILNYGDELSRSGK